MCLAASLSFSGFSCVFQTNREGANAGSEAFAGDQPISAQQESELGVDTESLDRMEKVADAYRRKAHYSEAEAIIHTSSTYAARSAAPLKSDYARAQVTSAVPEKVVEDNSERTAAGRQN